MVNSIQTYPKVEIDFTPKIPPIKRIKDKTQIDIRYGLISPFAFAHIYWDAKNFEVVYDIEIYDPYDDTLLYEDTFELDVNNKVISFGFWSTEIPIDPANLLSPLMILVIIIIVFAIIAIIGLALYSRIKRERNKVPKHMRDAYGHKPKPNGDRKSGPSQVGRGCSPKGRNPLGEWGEKLEEKGTEGREKRRKP